MSVFQINLLAFIKPKSICYLKAIWIAFLIGDVKHLCRLRFRNQTRAQVFYLIPSFFLLLPLFGAYAEDKSSLKESSKSQNSVFVEKEKNGISPRVSTIDGISIKGVVAEDHDLGDLIVQSSGRKQTDQTLSEVIRQIESWNPSPSSYQEIENIQFKRKSNYWFRLKIENKNNSRSQLFLTLDENHVVRWDYQIRNSQGQVLDEGRFDLMGSTAGEGVRLIRVFPSINFNLPKGNSVEILSRLSVGNQSIHLLVTNEKGHENRVRRSFLVLGIHAGFALALILLNCFWFFYLGNVSHFYYGLYLSSILFTVATFSGLLDGVYAEWFRVSRYYVTLPIIILTSLLTLIFAQSLLDMKAHSEKWYSAGNTLIKTLGAVFAVSLIPNMQTYLTSDVGDFCAGIALIFVLSSSIWAWRRSVAGARFLVYAWVSLATSVGIWMAGEYDLIPRIFLVQYSVAIGQTVEMIWLALAMSEQLGNMQTNKALAEARAEDRNRLRDLLRIVSHDLANPLTVVMSYVEFLSKIVDSENSSLNAQEKNKTIIERMKKSLVQMSDIMKRVRNISALEGGKIHLSLEPFSIGLLVRETITNMEPQAKNKKILILTNADDVRGVIVCADRVLMESTVLNNIISNAIKFSPEGGRIGVMVEKDSLKVKVRVYDEGIGIPQDLQSEVFEPEKRTSRLGTGGEVGTGFGLPLVKAYIRQFGGDVEIESPVSQTTFEIFHKNCLEKSEKKDGAPNKPAAGTCFIFWLPIAEVSKNQENRDETLKRTS